MFAHIASCHYLESCHQITTIAIIECVLKKIIDGVLTGLVIVTLIVLAILFNPHIFRLLDIEKARSIDS